VAGPEEAAEAWLSGDRMMRIMILFLALCLLRAEEMRMGEPMHI
jgi:hypothetical protein